MRSWFTDETRLQAHRRGFERAVLSTMWLGAALGSAGAVLAMVAPVVAFLDEATAYRTGVFACATGLILGGLATVLSHPLQTLHTVGTTGGKRYDRLRNWTRLKVSSILLNLLGLVALAVLVTAVLTLFGAVDPEATVPPALQPGRLVLLLAAAMAVTAAVAHAISLRTPIERTRTGLEAGYFALAAAGGVVTTLIAAAVSLTPLRVGPMEFLPGHAPFFLLAAVTAFALGVFIARSLPTVYHLFVEERDFYQGRTHVSRTKSVVMPTMIAFALLFLVLLVLLVFQVGVVGLVEDIPSNAVLLSVFGFVSVALVVSVIVSFTLSRSEDRAAPFRSKRSVESKREIAILVASAAATTVLLALAATLFSGHHVPGLSLGRDRWLDLLAFAILAAVGPAGFYYGHRAKRIRKLEERFPDFLRDVAASRRAGLTLESSVAIAARGEYGELTPEIRKMADQLSWNVPFEEALKLFGERVRTPLIQRAVTLVNEAGRTGGHVTDVLMAAAADAREIKNLENERRTTMGLYSIIVYISFLVFLGVAAVLYAAFVPQIVAAAEAVAATGSGRIGTVELSRLALSDYRTFFFMAALVQGTGNGVVAGLMESGRGLTGLRHSFIMVAITYVTFGLVIG